MDVATLNKLNGGSGTASATKNAADTQDRFLKLLVAQMQNQDPMNPMDNAQVTSQMAQIQTVTGVQGLNTTIQGLSSQFTQLQALQSVALVGHDVALASNNLVINKSADGVATGKGSYDLTGAADKVKLEVLSPAGLVVDTVELGAQSAGLHKFSWPADKAVGYDSLNFRITASRGTAQVASTPYATDKVVAVSTNGTKLQVKLEGMGIVDYSLIKMVD